MPQGEYQTFGAAFRNRSTVMFEIEGSPNITGRLATNNSDGACLMAEVRDHSSLSV